MGWQRLEVVCGGWISVPLGCVCRIQALSAAIDTGWFSEGTSWERKGRPHPWRWPKSTASLNRGKLRTEGPPTHSLPTANGAPTRAEMPAAPQIPRGSSLGQRGLCSLSGGYGSYSPRLGSDKPESRPVTLSGSPGLVLVLSLSPW